MQIILAAILFLSPHLDKETATKYANVIHTMSKTQEMDPFLIISIIRAESNFAHNRKSKTNDFGLMQLHVSRTTFRELRGYGTLLYDPELNVYLGTKHLRMFRKWHHKKCGPDHLWWRHYKWGFKKKFPNDKWAVRVLAFHQRLVDKFRGKAWREVAERLTPTAFQDWLSWCAKNNCRLDES